MGSKMRVIQGRLAELEPHRTSAIEAAYQHFRLDRQGSLASPTTRVPCAISSPAGVGQPSAPCGRSRVR